MSRLQTLEFSPPARNQAEGAGRAPDRLAVWRFADVELCHRMADVFGWHKVRLSAVAAPASGQALARLEPTHGQALPGTRVVGLSRMT